MKIVGSFLLLVFLIIGSGLAVYFSVPEGHFVEDYFWDEDSLIENLSAGTFLLAFVGGLVVLARGVRRHADRWWLVLISGLGLLGFLDELSYGERLFELEMPTVKQLKFDGIHDLIDWCYFEGPEFVARHQAFSLLVLVATLCFLSAILFLWRRGLRNLARDSASYPLYALLLCFVILLFCAEVIDLGLLDSWSEDLPVVEELCEWSAAIALCFCGYVILGRGRCSGRV